MGSCLSNTSQLIETNQIHDSNYEIIKFDIISSMPTELLHYYFSYLDPISLTKIILINSKFKKESSFVLELTWTI